jgi:hypothetical protein
MNSAFSLRGFVPVADVLKIRSCDNSGLSVGSCAFCIDRERAAKFAREHPRLQSQWTPENDLRIHADDEAARMEFLLLYGELVQ